RGGMTPPCGTSGTFWGRGAEYSGSSSTSWANRSTAASGTPGTTSIGPSRTGTDPPGYRRGRTGEFGCARVARDEDLCSGRAHPGQHPAASSVVALKLWQVTRLSGAPSAITAAPAPPGVADGVRPQPYDRPLVPRPSALVLTGSGDAPRPRSGCGSPVKPHPRHNRCPAVQLSLAAGAELFGESTVAESE